MTPPRLRGIFAPVLTPVASDLSPDEIRFTEHCRGLIADGCHGLAIFGTTGEANSFSVAERRALLDHLIASGVDAAMVLPGTGCCALPDTIELTRHAVDAGCAGVLVLPPFYYKDVSSGGVFDAYQRLIEGIGDGRLRIYLYHFPRMSGVPLEVSLVARLLEAYPETIAGLKDSSGSLESLHAFLAMKDELQVFAGTEALLVENLRAGGAGCITATANVNARALRRLFDRWQGSDRGELHANVLAFRKTLERYPLIPALKALRAHREGDPAWKAVRPPLRPLPADNESRLLADLGPSRS